MKTFPKINLV
jgi:hypothetical protein